eukprot:TRINITY_DN4772_c0_g1_i1.p1 TRINITY_DN4772_c0_g1~~TRINITY_DN4772_c0_g1_i1.p1  ORF type:complete len:285 (-),score=35.73 TRINITY_DN4772_c0_g1_i1:131-985(-)
MGTSTSQIAAALPAIERFPILRRLTFPVKGAHRGGASKFGPENCLDTYRKSVHNAHTELLEIDLHLSKDGHIVLHHNTWINFNGGGTRYIKEMTLEELKRVDIGYNFSPDGITFPLRGKNEVIPTLNEVLDEFVPKDNLCFFFDMKAEEAVEPTIRVIQERGITDRVIFGAVDSAINQTILKLRPNGVPVAADVKTMMGLLSSYAIGCMNAAAKPQEIMGFYLDTRTVKLLSKNLFDAIHKQGKFIAVFGPLLDYKENIEMLMDWETDFLLSDNPDILDRTLRH